MAALGPEAAAAAPALVEKIRGLCPRKTDTKFLDAEVVRSAFADALVAIGEPALEHLPLGLDESQESVRYTMVEIVARFGRVVVPQLIAALQEGAKYEQINAAWAVHSMKETVYETLPAIHMALARALKPDAEYLSLGKDGKIRKVEVRHEYSEADRAFLESLSTGVAPKPLRLRDHGIVMPCLAVLKKFGARAAETIPTVEYAIAVARGDEGIRMVAEDTLKALRKK